MGELRRKEDGMKYIPKVLTAVSLAVAIMCVVLFIRCSPSDEEVAEVEVIESSQEEERFDWEAWEREREERWAREEAEAAARRAELEAGAAERAAQAKARELERRERRRLARDKLWLLRSPQAIRESLWAIPREGGEEETVEALLRICISEAGWRPEALRDCFWIWQVVQNIRSRSCSESPYQDQMECEEDEETNLSAMRRLSGRVLDESEARSVRQKFISNIDLSCDRPLWFPRGDSWERNLKRSCERMASEVRAIIQLKSDRRLTNGAIPIAWGGRCEDSGGACDDEVACRRGLARIPDTKTYNAYWCRPGSPGCASEIDPVCRRYRRSLPVASSRDGEEEEEEAFGR